MEASTGNTSAQLGNTIVQLLDAENAQRLEHAKEAIFGLTAMCLSCRGTALHELGSIGRMLQLVAALLDDIKIGVTPEDLPG